MTRGAGRREIRCHVVRGIVRIEAGRGRVIEILGMAAITSRGQHRREIATEVASGVRARAGRHSVGTLQRERGRAVIELSVRPRDRVMALHAIRKCKRRSGRGMHRIICLHPGGLVASRVSAIGRRGRQIVVIVDVT